MNSKMDKNEILKNLLAVLLNPNTDSGRYTSMDICDLLSDTYYALPTEVTVCLMEQGWGLAKQDDRLVWYHKSHGPAPELPEKL